MAEWCIYNRERITGMRVVELGSGAGLVGLTCYKLCQPSFVTLTDYHPKVLETLRYNLVSNITSTADHQRGIEIQPLDWIEFSKDGSSSLPADVVLASGKTDLNKLRYLIKCMLISSNYACFLDVVYDADLIPGLVGTLTKLLDGSNNRQKLPIASIVACTERNEETLERFLSELGKSHIKNRLTPFHFYTTM